MKVKNIKIGIESLEKGLERFARVIEDAKVGRFPKKPIEGIYFESVEGMRKVLTPKRLNLLHMIRVKKPGSIYELAHLVKRDLKNVQDDVALLHRIGLLSLSRTRKARRRVVPHVNYDNLQLQIPVV
jgi:predicted transcriptional regulator